MKRTGFVYHIYQDYRRLDKPQAFFYRMRDAKKYGALYFDGTFLIRRWPAAEAKTLLETIQEIILPEYLNDVLNSSCNRRMAATCLINGVYSNFEAARDSVISRREALQ